MEINFKQTLFSLDSRNQKCNDCADDDVKYVSINNGITLCELCAQIHKNFGNQISYIRSINDVYDDYLKGFFIYGGNKKFRKTLKQMGVNLDQKKGNLYRTYGADFYRRNLKSLVKGNSRLDKDYDNPNEVMKNDSHSFPEFENYIINQNTKNYPIPNFNGNYLNNNIINNTNNINEINELNNLNLNIDLDNNSNFGPDVINNPIDNEFNTNNVNNNNEIQINAAQDKKIESIENKPETPKEEEQKAENHSNRVEVRDDDEDSAERRVKKLVNMSVKGVKKLGKLMKKGGIKGFGLAKKYGKATVKMTKKYVKENVSYFNKNKDNHSDAKGDNYNQ